MTRRKRSLAISYGLSALLHGGFVTVVLLAAIPARKLAVSPDVDTAVRPSVESDSTTDTAFEVAQPVDDSAASAGADVLADVDATDDGMADFTRRRLEQAREHAESRLDVEQLGELETLARRLSHVSSEESVTQLTEAIAPWIGNLSSRATEPNDAADPSVPFDVSTAQISDVLKQEEGGSLQYVAVMVDAAGLTQQTPLDVADGQTLYDVFQLMKRFPLLKTVYQKTVMGLLDRLVEEERAAAEPSSPADDPGDAQQQNDQ